MCGGFAALYAQHSDKNFVAHSLYNLGRLTTYLTLGVLAAWLGASIDGFMEFGKFSALLVGSVLIAAGIIQLVKGRIVFFPSLLGCLGKMVGSIGKPLFKSSGAVKPFLIGLITTLLPCGWLYAFVALALASADPQKAVVIMFFFWLGTLPAMVAVGVLSQTIVNRFGSHTPRITALLLILGGLLSVTAHLQHSHHNHNKNADHYHHH